LAEFCGASLKACRLGIRAELSDAETNLGAAGVDAHATNTLDSRLRLRRMG
jgi:hypothetical protein